MGYTHYFNFNKGIGQFTEQVISDVKVIVKHYKDILAVEEISADNISLNGIEPNDYEQFEITGSIINYNFCKTATKPYDLPVSEILLILKHFYSDNFQLESDGFYISTITKQEVIDNNWITATTNVKHKFGYEFEFVEAGKKLIIESR